MNLVLTAAETSLDQLRGHTRGRSLFTIFLPWGQLISNDSLKTRVRRPPTDLPGQRALDGSVRLKTMPDSTGFRQRRWRRQRQLAALSLSRRRRHIFFDDGSTESGLVSRVEERIHAGGVYLENRIVSFTSVDGLA